VFGLSFGELVIVVIVAIVVIGPKDLPRMLRKAGQWAGKLRRMATDVRAQSGIDEVLRSEGLTKDLNEIRRLAQGDLLDPIPLAPIHDAREAHEGVVIVREREYPREGADSYGALPDTAHAYMHGLPPSALARDPLYIAGDADAELPPPPDAPATNPAAGDVPVVPGAGGGATADAVDAADTADPATKPADRPAPDAGPV
jgi:sec-independent protein translocase protein TatB